MFHKLKRDLSTKFFDMRCEGVLRTPPLRTTDAPLRIVTLIQHRDLMMYLLACKSFYSYVREGGFFVIDDGSLTNADKELLSRHLNDPPIISVADISTGGLPAGSCWERLVKILELSADNYVIQLDADTLTLSEIPEVVAAYRDNVAFTLGTSQGRAIVSCEEASAFAAPLESEHVQVVAEKQLGSLAGPGSDRYVRGCAGFAGFPRGNAGRARLERVSLDMEKRIGRKWHEWGSEQVASNFVVANDPGACVLPYPKYASFYLNGGEAGRGPDQLYASSAFLHFLGSFRFSKRKYEIESRRFIARSMQAVA